MRVFFAREHMLAHGTAPDALPSDALFLFSGGHDKTGK